MHKSLQFLEQIMHNLHYVDYDIIYNVIRDMPDKAIPIAKIKKGAPIDRVRINKNGQIFNSISEINYITDSKVLESLEFGRANKAKQGVFYGAIESNEISQHRIVSYFETSEILKDLDKFDTIEEIFTVSRWIVKEEFQVIEMIFSDEAIKASIDTKSSYDFQLLKLADESLKEHYIAQLKFFSNEFAKVEIDTTDDYKISSAYINYLWDNTSFKGVTYPSVKSLYKGQNIALKPECVDKYLELELVCMCKFERKNNTDLPIEPCFKIATDFGIDKMNFKWEDYNEKTGANKLGFL
jgi:hypothetical protein